MTGRDIRRVVYTTNFGGYEQVNDDQAESPSVRFLCYTDMPDLKSERWEIRVVKPAFPLDTVRSQRIFKIRGDEALDGYDEILYVDNCISLRTDVSALFDEWLAAADIAFMLHGFRRDVAAEFAEIVRTGLDDAQRVFEQFDHYAATQPEVLGQRPFWAGMFARRPTPEVNAALTRWLDHVLRYSRRDQLSVRAAFHDVGLSVNEVDIDNHLSRWHVWPVDVQRNTTGRFASGSLRYPDLLKVASLETELEDTRRVAAQAEAARAQIEQLNDVCSVAAKQLAEVRSEISELRRSRSWRVTAPLRRVTAALHARRNGSGPA